MLGFTNPSPPRPVILTYVVHSSIDVRDGSPGAGYGSISILISTGDVCTSWTSLCSLRHRARRFRHHLASSRHSISVHIPTLPRFKKPSAALDSRLAHRVDRESGWADIISRTAWAPWSCWRTGLGTNYGTSPYKYANGGVVKGPLPSLITYICTSISVITVCSYIHGDPGTSVCMEIEAERP